MTTGEHPKGQRFSHVYLSTPELLPDSARMRRRIGHIIGDTPIQEFPRQLAAELGIYVDTSSGTYRHYWPSFLEKANLRDVLDTITIRYRTLKPPVFDSTGELARKFKGKFLHDVRRIFEEERVRYKIDEQGGVHFTVDAEFESIRASTISSMGTARYTAVRTAFDETFNFLDMSPPDGKAAIRSVFFANECLFRLMFSSAPQLNGGELNKHLRPRIDAMFGDQKPAIHAAQKQLSGFREWIDAAHFYRHEPGTEDPAQPPLDLAIYFISLGSSHLRWLIKLDTAGR